MNLLLNNLWLWACLLWTATGIIAGHYFVSKFDLFKDGIALTARYVIGTLTWLIPLTVFVVEVLQSPVLAGVVWLFVTVAGGTDLAVYLVDELDLAAKFGAWLKEKLRIG